MTEPRIWRSAVELTGNLGRRTRGRVFRSLATALVVAGGTFAACQSSGITSPSSSGGMSPKGSSGDLIGTGVVTKLVPLKEARDPEVEQANPDFATTTETVFPTTEVMVNSCHNDEAPVLSGFLRMREKIAMDDLTLKYKLQTWKDTRGVFATATTYYDDDNDPATAPRTVLVRYRNRTNTLDMFTTGPAGLPFASDQESVMLLERLSPEHGMRYGKYDDREDDDDDRDYRHGQGDDLFVYVRQSVYVDKNGVQREKAVFRTECR